MVYLLILFYLFFTVSGLILLKLGGESFSFILQNGTLHFVMPWKFLLGFISYLCSFVIWTMLLQKFNLIYMYPILVGLANVLVLFSGFFILKEKLTTLHVVGSMVVILGIVLMNLQK